MVRIGNPHIGEGQDKCTQNNGIRPLPGRPTVDQYEGGYSTSVDCHIDLRDIFKPLVVAFISECCMHGAYMPYYTAI